jgi:predicted GNAT family acetyltransferase
MNVWKKLRNLALAEPFLRKRELYCVNAISRFISGITGNAWAAFLQKTDKQISGLLLYGKRLLFPVFDSSLALTAKFPAEGMPLPLFFPLVLKKESIHAAQGLADDMDMLETALKTKGIAPSSTYDYELRSLMYSESAGFSLHSPPGLVIRRAEPKDAAALYPLQAGYEQEEVLPEGTQFNPASCRRGLDRLIDGNMVLAAEMEGRLVGKININAQSYNCFQIGGVYVAPEYRRLGIAQAMTACLIREFLPQKKIFTLFVKKANVPARQVYDTLGFEKIADYRITYYP